MTGRLGRAFGALLVLLALTGCTGRPDGVEPVTGFDVQRYMGTWYSARRLDHPFERGLTNVTAAYSLQPDGTVKVVNRGWNPEDCDWSEVVGTAEFQGDPDVASLSVTFRWPFAGGYHVFALDTEGYQWAAVSGPTTDFLWFLSRTPELPEGVLEELTAKAKALGFPVAELLPVIHGEPVCRSE